MLQIRNNYISVDNGQRRSFGGNQMSSASRNMREVGCGVIAALDLLLYLCRFHPGCRCGFFAAAAEDGCIDEQEYDDLAQKLSRSFFPVIPKLGINGNLNFSPYAVADKGDKIGTVGNSGKSTGTHLHYEVEYKGEKVNPMNYMDINMPIDEYKSMVEQRSLESPNGKRSSTSTLIRKRNAQ